jgi:stage V sporulation protein SpoVS
MRRSLPLLAGAIFLIALAFSPGASASTCTTSSPNVVGKSIEGMLTSSEVNSVQAEFATCGYAQKVMKTIADARIEETGDVEGFYCQIVSALQSRPAILGYSCTFKGADTAMFVKLTFSVKYKRSTPCVTSSQNVIGGKVTGTLSARNVNPVQAEYATCANAKKAMKRITGLRIEMPKSVAGLYCKPVVISTEPDVVKYTCTFKGADTPMFVKVAFKVTYDMD